MILVLIANGMDRQGIKNLSMTLETYIDAAGKVLWKEEKSTESGKSKTDLERQFTGEG